MEELRELSAEDLKYLVDELLLKEDKKDSPKMKTLKQRFKEALDRGNISLTVGYKDR